MVASLEQPVDSVNSLTRGVQNLTPAVQAVQQVFNRCPRCPRPEVIYIKSKSEGICKKIYGFSSKISGRTDIFRCQNFRKIMIGNFENLKISKFS